MFQILGLIFFIIFFVLIIGFTILYKVVRTVLGIRKNTQKQTESFDNSNDQGYSECKRKDTPKTKNKVFDKNEGEYIEFEEIKD